MSQTDMAGCSGVDSAPDTPWLSEGSGKRRLLLGVRPSSVGTFLSTAQPACESYPAGSQGLSPNQNRLCFSQSPKGFLESYEEMLSYALRPETWATTRLELEGRGVSWLLSSFLGPTELRSFWWELVPSSTCMLSS